MGKKTSGLFENELNECVAYVAETLDYCRRKYASTFGRLSELTGDDCVFEAIKNEIDLSIRVCCGAEPNDDDDDDDENRRRKELIFAFFLDKYFNANEASRVINRGEPISFELIVNLAVQNRPFNLNQILTRYEQANVIEFYEKTISYLRSMLSVKVANVRLIQLFLIDLSVNNLPTISIAEKVLLLIDDCERLAQLVNIRFARGDVTSGVNSIVERMLKLVGLFDHNVDNYGNNLRTLFHDERTHTLLKQLTKFILYLSDNFTHTILIRANSTHRLLNFYSFMAGQTNLTADLFDLADYLRRSIEQSLALELDENYLIQKRLVGFEVFLERKLSSRRLDQSPAGLTADDVQTLMNVKDFLRTNFEYVYAVLRQVDASTDDSPIKRTIIQLFWSLFDELHFDLKMQLIQAIYSRGEIKLDELGQAVNCLNTTDASSEFILVLNKLSSQNFDDAKIVNSLARLMCTSLGSTTYRVMLNLISTRSQIEPLKIILDKFSKLMVLNVTRKKKSTTKCAVGLDCLRKILDHLIDCKNEKLFQNYTSLLNMTLAGESNKSREISHATDRFNLNADDFYHHVVFKDYFNASVIDINKFYYIFQIYELLLKFIHVDVTQLALIMEILKNVDAKLHTANLPSASQAECLKLKEKCIILVGQLVDSLIVNSQPNNTQHLNWFRDYSICNFNWTYNLLTFKLTQSIYVPSSLEDILALKASSWTGRIDYFHSDVHYLHSLLELASMQMLEQFDVRLNLDRLTYQQILAVFIQFFRYSKTSWETKNLFKYMMDKLIPNAGFKIELDDNLTLRDNEIFVKFLNLFSDVFIFSRQLPKPTTNMVFINFLQFVKEYVKLSKGENGNVECSCVPIVMYYFGKMCVFMRNVDDYYSHELCKIVVELSNDLCQMSLDKKTTTTTTEKSSQVASSMLDMCKQLFLRLDDSLKTYQYLILNNLNSLYLTI